MAFNPTSVGDSAGQHAEPQQTLRQPSLACAAGRTSTHNWAQRFPTLSGVSAQPPVLSMAQVNRRDAVDSSFATIVTMEAFMVALKPPGAAGNAGTAAFATVWVTGLAAAASFIRAATFLSSSSPYGFSTAKLPSGPNK